MIHCHEDTINSFHFVLVILVFTVANCFAVSVSEAGDAVM